MILSAFAVLVTFGLVIFIHELGHFILCRVLGVKVERFAFGFGPELIGFTRGETRYSVCALPLGGFVKPAGEEIGEATGNPDEYFSRPWHQRLLIVWAGPVMNYLLAWVLFSGVCFLKGIPEQAPGTVIGDVFIEFPAYQAGIRPDDRIVEIGGKPVGTWQEMADSINAGSGREMEVTFERGREKRTVRVTPQHNAEIGRGVIGIAPVTENKRPGLWGAVKEGLYQDWYWTKYTVTTLVGKIVRREKPDLAGPIGIVNLVHRAAHSGWEDLVFLIALISVAIGFFNFLPIPLLDGGHAVLYIWEGITKRRLTEKTMAVANTVGMAFLMSILLFATYQDIMRLRRHSKLRTDTPDASKPVANSTGTAPSPSPVPAKK